MNLFHRVESWIVFDRTYKNNSQDLFLKIVKLSNLRADNILQNEKGSTFKFETDRYTKIYFSFTVLCYQI